jgi:hypothetical protein
VKRGQMAYLHRAASRAGMQAFAVFLKRTFQALPVLGTSFRKT